jgi:hypothetical protein
MTALAVVGGSGEARAQRDPQLIAVPAVASAAAA